MDMKTQLPPVSRRKKSRLDPITPDVFRRSQTGFGSNDANKAMQILMEENEQLKKELEGARKEIFQLKEENLQLKKQAKGPTPSAKSTSGTFLTSGGGSPTHEEDSKVEGDEVICKN